MIFFHERVASCLLDRKIVHRRLGRSAKSLVVPIADLVAVGVVHLAPPLANLDTIGLVIHDQPASGLRLRHAGEPTAKSFLKFADVPALVYSARSLAEFPAHRRRLARRNAKLRERIDHARTTEPHVRAAEATPDYE